MDKLTDALANVSMYDVKAYVRKAQNAVLNFSDIESKVREATNNEPWGASTTIMQEIADASQSYQQFHEIMPFIYRRFTEKTAAEWRQIYKSLQLLEYLVKNGSERVVDYARSHTAVIDMLRHFHYVDREGRDQGVNIRNRAEELLTLLSSVDKIRAERKRSKALNQRTGVGSIGSSASAVGSGSLGGPSSSSSSRRYGGMGSSTSGGISYGGGGYGRKVYGDGGGFDGSNYDGPGIEGDDEFEEYTASEIPSQSGSTALGAGNGSSSANITPFISFDDDAAPATPAKTTNGHSAPAVDDNDDFDDFQSAVAPANGSSPPAMPTTSNNILDLFSASSPAGASATNVPPPTSFNTSLFSPAVGGNSAAKPGTLGSGAPPKPTAKTDAFSGLWEESKITAKPIQLQPKQAPATTSASTSGPKAPPKPADDDDLLLF